MPLPRQGFGLSPAVAIAALVACNGILPTGGAGHEVQELQVGGAVDVLFVIESAGSIWERQEPLARAFPRFLAALRGSDGELPSLHVGVVSTSPGMPGFTGGGCRPDGDGGLLQSPPRGRQRGRVPAGGWIASPSSAATACTSSPCTSRIATPRR